MGEGKNLASNAQCDAKLNKQQNSNSNYPALKYQMCVLTQTRKQGLTSIHSGILQYVMLEYLKI